MIDIFAKLFVQTAHAQWSIINADIPGCNFGGDPTIVGDGPGFNAGLCIPSFIAHLIQMIFAFAGSVCVIMIIFGGYEIVIGNLPGGSSESGKNRITWAIIGFVMAATSFYIMDFIIAAISGSSL